MADEVVIGANEMTEQPVRRSYSQGQGWKTIRSWEGPQALAADKEDEILLLSPAPESIDTSLGVPARIEATFATTGGSADIPDLTDEQNAVWELIGEDLEKPIGTHGFYNLAAGTAAAMEAVDEAIRKGKARNTLWDTVYAGSNMQSYCNHKLRGIDTYVTFSFVVRKTITTSNATLLDIEFDILHRPGRIITWAGIDIPAAAKFRQPQVHTYSAAGWGPTLINEWLIKAPTVRWQKGRRVWELTREWWGAEKWSVALYDGGSYTP